MGRLFPLLARCFAVFLLLVCPASVRADPITITLADLDLRALPGERLTVRGTLLNTSAAIVHVNSSGGAVNINNPPGSTIVLDATFFIRPNLTTFILQPGQATAVIPFVTLLISPNAPVPSMTSGTFDVCGGAGPTACADLGSVFYSVRVTTDPVPEPAMLTLLGTGLAGLIGMRRRLKRSIR